MHNIRDVGTYTYLVCGMCATAAVRAAGAAGAGDDLH